MSRVMAMLAVGVLLAACGSFDEESDSACVESCAEVGFTKDCGGKWVEFWYLCP